LYGQRSIEIVFPIAINVTAGFGVRVEGIAIAPRKVVEWVFRIDVSCLFAAFEALPLGRYWKKSDSKAANKAIDNRAEPAINGIGKFSFLAAVLATVPV